MSPKRIILLPESVDGVVAHFVTCGKVDGEFMLRASGEVWLRYCSSPDRSWYANKTIEEFREAVVVFNRCCELHADDEDTDSEFVWATLSSQLRTEFERIEPIGDPESSIWSATVHDHEFGLLSLC